MTESALPLPADAPARRFTIVRKVVRVVAELREAVAQASFSLIAHKLRAVLTISGISLGIAILIGIFTVLSGFQASFLRQLNTLGPNTLFVHKWKWGANNDWWRYRNRPVVTQMDWRALQAGAMVPGAISPNANTEAA